VRSQTTLDRGEPGEPVAGEPERLPGPPPGQERAGGVWYPRWFWPSFAAPATLWLIILFALPFYVILAVAFGTVDPIFQNPLPIYQPWWWSFTAFNAMMGKIFGADAYFQAAYVRTFIYVFAASALCLVIGYSVAYFVARYGGRRRAMFLILLIAPFWINYLMRMFAWQSLLEPDGYVNDFLRILPFLRPRNWLAGEGITVVLGLVYGYIPYMILPLYGQLDRIGQEMLEAGRDLGASPAQTFVRVTLPLSRQAILAGLVIVSLPMFGDYYTNDLLSNSPRTSMIGNLIDNSVLSPGRTAQGASMVLTVMVILIFPMLYYLRSTKRATEAGQ
jgi:ABC-type spermidine/putrescine transport system permease subunit I